MTSDASSLKKDDDQEILPSSNQTSSFGQKDATKGENSENYEKMGMIQWETKTESGVNAMISQSSKVLNGDIEEVPQLLRSDSKNLGGPSS